MTEPGTDPNQTDPGRDEALPWWARPGKLAWFGLTGGLGCALGLLAILGGALARALAEPVGGPHGLTLRFLELGMALMLVIPAHLAFALFVRNELDRRRGRTAPADQVSSRSPRSLPMSNEAFWVIGGLGLIAGSNMALVIMSLVIGAVSGGELGKEALDPLLPVFLVLYLGVYSLCLLFFLTRGTDGPNPDGKPKPDG